MCVCDWMFMWVHVGTWHLVAGRSCAEAGGPSRLTCVDWPVCEFSGGCWGGHAVVIPLWLMAQCLSVCLSPWPSAQSCTTTAIPPFNVILQDHHSDDFHMWPLTLWGCIYLCKQGSPEWTLFVDLRLRRSDDAVFGWTWKQSGAARYWAQYMPLLESTSGCFAVKQAFIRSQTCADISSPCEIKFIFTYRPVRTLLWSYFKGGILNSTAVWQV